MEKDRITRRESGRTEGWKEEKRKDWDDEGLKVVWWISQGLREDGYTGVRRVTMTWLGRRRGVEGGDTKVK